MQPSTCGFINVKILLNFKRIQLRCRGAQSLSHLKFPRSSHRMISKQKKKLQVSRLFRVYIVVSALSLFFFLVYFMDRSVPNAVLDPIEIAKKCYLHDGRNPNGTGKSITFFEDLLTAKSPEYDQGIFFVETKCSDNAIANISSR